MEHTLHGEVRGTSQLRSFGAIAALVGAVAESAGMSPTITLGAA